jgi:predicted signal transduction protein with EAL and GGDEF domain
MTAQRLLRSEKGRGLGLEIRFVLLVVCLAGLFAGIASISVMSAERANRDAMLGHAAIALAGQALTERFEALTGTLPQAREAALKSIAAKPGVERAELYDAQGALSHLESRSDRRIWPAGEDVRAALAQGEPLLRLAQGKVSIALPILQQGAVTGALRLILDRDRLAGAPPSALGGLALGLLAVLLFGGGIAFLMARRITQPLQQLTQYARSLSQQHQSNKIEIHSGDEFETLAGAFNAVTARFEESMRRIERLAFRDPATDLPNLAGAHRVIAEQIDASLAAHEAGVVFVLRVERLDNVAEMIGNDRAQELIGMIGARLRLRLKSIDQTVRLTKAADRPSILARMGGADFCVVTPSFSSGADAGRFAQRLAAALGQPIEWRDQMFSFGGRVGAAVFPRDGQDPDTLIRHATLAVGVASGEPGRARFFAREMEKAAARRITAERDIRAAIEQRAFVAHFQPKIDLQTRRVVGAEALARWMQPNGVMIGPGQFIGPAEEFGLIGPISEAVLVDACWKAAGWAREGDPIKVSVNVSPLQLADDRFTDRVKRVLLETGMPPNLLELEITESVALTDPEQAGRLVYPLKDIGVSIALDDFGCGHSSLTALSRLPFDIVKIDQQFVRALDKDPHAPAIIETILTLANRLGCDVVAEGVETEREAEWLERQGCRIAQGFLFGPAMPPHEFRRMQQTYGHVLPDSDAAQVA